MASSKPSWLKKKHSAPGNYIFTRHLLKDLNINTVCDEAHCPNRNDCFGDKNATFLLLGKYCTRNCLFCSIEHDMSKLHIDELEPQRIALAVQRMQLKYVVLTSVTRDDLEDGGAGMFIRTVEEIRKLMNDIKIEVLIPDFNGNLKPLQDILDIKPAILNHNIEMIKELYPIYRPYSSYFRSLELLSNANSISEIPVKTGFMVGLGESKEQIESLLEDIHECGVDILTIGQYIAPTSFHARPVRYYHPAEFDELKQIANDSGIRHVLSGPFVRSSFKAYDTYMNLNKSDMEMLEKEKQ
ncbi:MAG: lipoyl synthase [Candidatus Coatesbacteria bacterium]|nr:lipoyl synthase [Candidatus Coatesbacteria bacterium]